jgi:hypothetical protein
MRGIRGFIASRSLGLIAGISLLAACSALAQQASQHAVSPALVTSLVAKASPGSLVGFNCSSIAGGAAGFCVAVNATTAPSTGTIVPIDFCYFDTSARGCSLNHLPGAVNYTTGIVILMTSAASPYTYTTGTDTGAISADYQ